MNDASLTSSELYEELKAKFCKTLRELCEGRGSINQVCVEIGINRQQFAKYLSGDNLPSMYILQRIIKYFEADPKVFFLTEFAKLSSKPKAKTVKIPEKTMFFLEYAPIVLADGTCMRVSAWRFDRFDDGETCHGEVPQPSHGIGRQAGSASRGRAYYLSSFKGEITTHGESRILRAETTRDPAQHVVYLMRKLEFTISDFVAANIQTAAAAPLLSTVSMLRYVGESPDLLELINTNCGIFPISELDAAEAGIWTRLTERSELHELGVTISA